MNIFKKTNTGSIGLPGEGRGKIPTINQAASDK